LGEALPSNGDGLTGEATANEIDALNPFKIEGADVSVPLDIGPVFRKDALAEGVNLDLPATRPPGALEPEVESADPGEEGTEGGHFMPPAARPS
jgi:hypothetical protein